MIIICQKKEKRKFVPDIGFLCVWLQNKLKDLFVGMNELSTFDVYVLHVDISCIFMRGCACMYVYMY